jgi:hypothetical protein
LARILLLLKVDEYRTSKLCNVCNVCNVCHEQIDVPTTRRCACSFDAEGKEVLGPRDTISIDAIPSSAASAAARDSCIGTVTPA